MKYLPCLLLAIVSNCFAQTEKTSMSVENTKAVMTKYLNSNHADVSIMADDVIFTIMSTGQQHKGQDAVLQMLNYFYHIAFDADAEMRTAIYGEGNAIFEGTFKGKHIGEFAGVSATNKNVSVPICVVYDLENNKIKRGRVYFEMPVLFEQLQGSTGSLADNKTHEREKANILGVIENETKNFLDRRFEGWSSYWAHDPHVVSMGATGTTDAHSGWDSLSTYMKNLMATWPEPDPAQVQRENINMRVTDNMAFVIFDQYSIYKAEDNSISKYLSKESRVLEKQDGKWKIIYVGWLQDDGKTGEENSERPITNK